MSKFDGKKLILLGDEGGVSLAAMRGVFERSGATIIYAAIECFV